MGMQEHKDPGSSAPSCGRWKILIVSLSYLQQTTSEIRKDRGKLPVALLTSSSKMDALPKYGRNDKESQEQPWKGWWPETGGCGGQGMCVIYTDL